MSNATQQLTERVRAAAADGTVLRIRGGGSKDFYGHTIQGDVLDTRGLSGILSYEPSELVVTVGAGTPLVELEAALAEKGQCLAFEPPRFAVCSEAQAATVGGMVAAGLSGPSRANVGGVRDYVLGLDMINGRGELLHFGGTVMKNVAGYDLSRLMAGSWGCLGVITEVSLKVLPVAPAQATLAFELDQACALNQLHRWGAQPLPLNASCWIHHKDLPKQSMRLYVRLRGAKAAVESACRQMLSEVSGRRLDEAASTREWNACRDLRLPFFIPGASDELALWRLSVTQTAPVLDVPWTQLLEWHGAQRWVWAPVTALETLQGVAESAGGHATLFLAPGAHDRMDPPPPLRRTAPLAEPLARIQRQLKAEFDPAGIFNPGRLFD